MIRKAQCGERKKVQLIFLYLALAFTYAAGVSGYLAEGASAGDTRKEAAAMHDFQRLEGRWVRPDGGYVLLLSNAKKDGSFTASYYNPRQIRVYQAQAGRKNGVITLIVELRDTNYPGSTYTLKYDPVSDHLRGIYFQAVMRQTFEVEFVRVK